MRALMPASTHTARQSAPVHPIRTHRFSVVLTFALHAVLSGCASTSQETGPLEPLVFPSPPEQPRFVFERTFLGSGDVVFADSTTRWRQVLTGESQRGTGFSKPFDVVACHGRIYVSDTVRRSVFVLDVAGSQFLEIGTKEPGTLYKPLGLNVDGQCNLYVADGTARRVVIFDAMGTHLRSIGGKDWFERLSHIAVSPAGDRVYAVDTGGVSSDAHRVRVFDAHTGAHLHDIGTRGAEPGELNLPRDIELGPDGLLYVVDGGNFRVQVFETDGTFVRSFGSVGKLFGQFARPKGIASDPQGNVYVADASFGNFQIFSPTGELLLFVGSRSTVPDRAKYMLPSGIDVDEDGRVYMVDQFFRKVDVYRPAQLGEKEGFLVEAGRP